MLSLLISAIASPAAVPKQSITSLMCNNNEDPSHVLIWAGDAASFEEDTALYNSEIAAGVSGKGKGPTWGLVLDKAVVTTAAAAEPKFNEDGE